MMRACYKGVSYMRPPTINVYLLSFDMADTSFKAARMQIGHCRSHTSRPLAPRRGYTKRTRGPRRSGGRAAGRDSTRTTPTVPAARVSLKTIDFRRPEAPGLRQGSAARQRHGSAVPRRAGRSMALPRQGMAGRARASSPLRYEFVLSDEWRPRAGGGATPSGGDTAHG